VNSRDATRDAAAAIPPPPSAPAERRAAPPAPVPAPPAVPDHPAPWPGLAAAAEQAGIPLAPEQLGRFARYRDLLLDRGRHINLTAISDPDDVERRLFFDALLMLPTVDLLLAPGQDGGPRRLVDVGSGAGFPGLVLKIARPDHWVTLIEATGKKVAFLTEAIRELGLSGVAAVHARAEDAGCDLDHRGQYDLATARAVASLPALLELCVPLLRRGGHALFPKGLAIAEELAAARRAAAPLGVRLLAADPLPGAEGATRLVVARKTAPTPDRYPRRAGLPAREPLGGTGRRTEDGGRRNGRRCSSDPRLPSSVHIGTSP